MLYFCRLDAVYGIGEHHAKFSPNSNTMSEAKEYTDQDCRYKYTVRAHSEEMCNDKSDHRGSTESSGMLSVLVAFFSNISTNKNRVYLISGTRNGTEYHEIFTRTFKFL